MAADLSQGYLATVLRHGASSFALGTQRIRNIRAGARFAQPSTSTSTETASLSESSFDTQAGIGLVRRDLNAGKPEAAIHSNEESARPENISRPQPNQIYREVSPTASEKKATSPSALFHVNNAEENQELHTSDASNPRAERLPKRAGQLQQSVDASAIEFSVESSFPVTELHPGTELTVRRPTPSEHADSSTLSGKTREQTVHTPFVEGPSRQPPVRKESPGRRDQSTVALKPDSTLFLREQEHVSASQESSLSSPAEERIETTGSHPEQQAVTRQEQSSDNSPGLLKQTLQAHDGDSKFPPVTFDSQFSPITHTTPESSASALPTPAPFSGSSTSQSKKGSTPENIADESIAEESVSLQSIGETVGRKKLQAGNYISLRPLPEATSRDSRFSVRVRPSPELTVKAPTASEGDSAFLENTTSHSDEQAQDRTEVKLYENGTASLNRETVTGHEPDFNGVIGPLPQPAKKSFKGLSEQSDKRNEASSVAARDEVVRVPRSQISAGSHTNQRERRRTRQPAESVEPLKKAVALIDPSTFAVLPEASAVDKTERASVPAAQAEQQSLRESQPSKFNQPRLREALDRHAPTLRHEESPKLSIKRLDVRIINQSLSAPPKRGARALVRGAQQYSAGNLDRHYLGRFYLYF